MIQLLKPQEGKMKVRDLRTPGFLLLLIFALFSLSQGKTLVSKNEKALSIEEHLAKNDYVHYQKFSRLTDSYFAYEDESVGGEMRTDVYGFKGKSVRRAFLYSMAVPGLGEFYAGSKIRAAIFLGLDATLWALYFNYHGKGKDKEDEYEVFADEHWDEEAYREWWETLPDTVKDNFVETLPDEHNQQYYEMIGKYEDQFGWAWDDFNGVDSATGRLNQYMDIRYESNRLLKRGRYSIMFSLANHILSAFDAAIMVKKYNRKGERFGQLEFKMRLTETDYEMVPKLYMSVRF
jgi:hypothetical protein